MLGREPSEYVQALFVFDEGALAPGQQWWLYLLELVLLADLEGMLAGHEHPSFGVEIAAIQQIDTALEGNRGGQVRQFVLALVDRNGVDPPFESVVDHLLALRQIRKQAISILLCSLLLPSRYRHFELILFFPVPQTHIPPDGRMHVFQPISIEVKLAPSVQFFPEPVEIFGD